MVVGPMLACWMLVIVCTMLAPMRVVMHIALVTMGMLVSVRVAVLMRVLMGVSDAVVRVFVGVRVLVGVIVIVLMRVFVLVVHSSPRWRVG